MIRKSKEAKARYEGYREGIIDSMAGFKIVIKDVLNHIERMEKKYAAETPKDSEEG